MSLPLDYTGIIVKVFPDGTLAKMVQWSSLRRGNQSRLCKDHYEL